MIWFIVWLIVLIYASAQLPGWEWWFWILTFFIPPLILFPIIEAVS